uniref:Uncharacterized protein n=1 Tax=Tanacetum cinerariifolium TaxID=118510 RepID=A0A6L2NH47_TANCI|nr:hypothetical protein [Tanacetum cinerariifolium]
MGLPKKGGGGDGVLNLISSGVIGERVYFFELEVVGVLLKEEKLDEEVAMVDRFFEGAFGALGDETWSFRRFGSGSFSGCHGGNVTNEEDDELVVRNRRQFIRG